MKEKFTGHEMRSAFWQQARKAARRTEPHRDIFRMIQATFPQSKRVMVPVSNDIHPLGDYLARRNMRRITNPGDRRTG